MRRKRLMKSQIAFQHLLEDHWCLYVDSDDDMPSHSGNSDDDLSGYSDDNLSGYSDDDVSGDPDDSDNTPATNPVEILAEVPAET